MADETERAAAPETAPLPAASKGATLDEVLASTTPSFGRRAVPWLVLLAVVGAAATGAWAWVTRPVPVTVDVFVVGRGDVERTIPSVSAGRVVARRRARVAADVMARVVAVNAKKGDLAKKDAVIVQLDDSDARANLGMAESSYTAAVAAVAEAEARVATTKSVHERRKKQLEGDTTTPEAVEMAAMDAATAEAALGVARARVQEAKARVESAKAYLFKFAVRAPFDGVISEVWVEVGEATMAAGPSPSGGKAAATMAMESASRLFEAIALDDLYITAPIDEVDLSKVSLGLPARVTLDPWPKEPFLGKVRRIAAYVLDVEEQNRTVEVEVEIPEAWLKRNLRPGISADVEVIVDRKGDVVRVPSHAVLEGQRVLVVEKDGEGRERAVERRLTVGLENWRACEVLSGVAESERVIASAADGSRVKPGALVVVRNVLETEPSRTDAPRKESP